MKSLAKLDSVRIQSELVIPYSGRPLTKGSWWTEMLPNSRLPSPTKGIPDSTAARFDRTFFKESLALLIREHKLAFEPSVRAQARVNISS